VRIADTSNGSHDDSPVVRAHPEQTFLDVAIDFNGQMSDVLDRNEKEPEWSEAKTALNEP